MNVKLLRKVKRYILAEPKRLFMASYFVRKYQYGEMLNGRDFAKCGTAACIAGWTLLLNKLDPYFVEAGAHDTAADLLGINCDQALLLFEPRKWPEKFEKGLNDDGKLSTAKVAAARIEHFIKTKGAE
jgi:hypothetical protein